MGKIYYLDLKTLLETLEGQSCILQREVPKNITRLNDSSICYISIAQRQIISCVVVERNGKQFDALSILSALYGLENWDVTIVPEPKQSSPSLQEAQQSSSLMQVAPISTANPASDEQIIPYLLAPDAIAQLQSWSHKERLLARTVLLHIDGIRSIVHIRSQLSISPSSVEQILTLLYQKGVIGFRRRGM